MLSFIEFLYESLDNPWNLIELQKHHNFYKQAKKAAEVDYPEHSKLKVFKATDTNNNEHGHVLEFANKGSIEIHHLDKHNNSGVLNPSANKPNPKFIATMKQRIDHHTDKGYSVRVVGTSQMIHKYHKLSKMVYHKKRHISEPENYDHPGYDNTKSFTISPPKLFEMKKEIIQ